MFQDALQFFRPDLIFPTSPFFSPPPPPRSPDYAPHEVTHDSPFEGHDNDPISHPTDEGFDNWSSLAERLTLTTKLSFVIDRNLMTSASWKEILFDKSSTSSTWTNVDSLFLSLAATEILEIQNSPADGIRGAWTTSANNSNYWHRCFIN